MIDIWPTDEAFQFDVRGDEVVEGDTSFLVAVPHHKSIERSVAHSQAYTDSTL